MDEASTLYHLQQKSSLTGPQVAALKMHSHGLLTPEGKCDENIRDRVPVAQW